MNIKKHRESKLGFNKISEDSKLIKNQVSKIEKESDRITIRTLNKYLKSLGIPDVYSLIKKFLSE